MLTKSRVRVDLWSNNPIPLKLQQGDDAGRVLEFEITEDGAPVDLSGAAIVFSALKPDGKSVFNAVRVTDAQAGLAEYTVTAQTVAAAGQMRAQLQLRRDRELLHSKTLDVYIDPSVAGGTEEIQSETEVTALVDVLSEAQAVIENAKEQAEKIEETLAQVKEDGDAAHHAVEDARNALAEVQAVIERAEEAVAAASKASEAAETAAKQAKTKSEEAVMAATSAADSAKDSGDEAETAAKKANASAGKADEAAELATEVTTEAREAATAALEAAEKASKSTESLRKQAEDAIRSVVEKSEEAEKLLADAKDASALSEAAVAGANEAAQKASDAAEEANQAVRNIADAEKKIDGIAANASDADRLAAEARDKAAEAERLAQSALEKADIADKAAASANEAAGSANAAAGSATDAAENANSAAEAARMAAANVKDGKDGAPGKNGAPGKDGAAGKDGEDGKSAYELAKEAGFEGSQEAWLESLKASGPKKTSELENDSGFITSEQVPDPLPEGGAPGQVLKRTEGGTEWAEDQDTKYQLPPATKDQLGGIKVGKNLSVVDGVLNATDTTYEAATQAQDGLLSASDKQKLDTGVTLVLPLRRYAKGEDGDIVGDILREHKEKMAGRIASCICIVDYEADGKPWVFVYDYRFVLSEEGTGFASRTGMTSRPNYAVYYRRLEITDWKLTTVQDVPAGLSDSVTWGASHFAATPRAVKTVNDKITAHESSSTPHTYRDEGTSADYKGVYYRLAVVDGKPYLKVVSS